MAFDLHPILNAGQEPSPGLWYAVSPEDSAGGAPVARVGACANFEQLVGGAEKGRVLLSAGATPEGSYSDLHQLTISRDHLKWEQLPGGEIPARYEHASFLVGGAKGSRLYAFGGASEKGPLSDFWHYDKGSWSPVKPSGPIPSPRTFHSSSSMRPKNNTLIVFSGGDTGSAPVSDTKVHVFDPATNQWSSPQTTNTPPSPRQGHISAVVEDNLYIHGGMSGQNILSDLHILDLDTWTWSRSPVRGTTLPQLAAHGCAVIGRKLYMFGGLSPVVGASDQLHCLDTELLSWEQVKISGPPPPARLDHAMCTFLLPVNSETTGVNCVGASTEVSVGASKIESPQVTRSAGCSNTSPPNTVTVIGPDSVEQKDFALVTQSDQARQPNTRGELSTTQNEPSVAELKSTASGASRAQSQALNAEKSDHSNAADLSSSNDVEDLSKTLESSSLDCKAPDSGPVEAVSKDRVSVEDGVSNKSPVRLVPALFVFGGMDTSGHLHADCFIFRPGE